MKTHDDILALLTGCDSQKPMSKTMLQNKSGQSKETLDLIVNEMYERAMIGRCKLTRQGVTDDMLWPTGVVKPSNLPRRIYEINPPRHDLLKLKETPLMLNQSQDIPDDKTTIAPSLSIDTTKPKSLRILEYIETHPDCQQIDFKKELGIEFALNYIKYHLASGKVIPSSARRDRTYRLKEGMTAEQIYGNGLKNNGGARRASLKEDPKKPIKKIAEAPALITQNIEIPAFLRKANQDAVINYEAEFCIKTLVPYIPDNCHITMRKPAFENIQVEIDGTMFANPFIINLDKLHTVFGAIKTLQQAAQL